MNPRVLLAALTKNIILALLLIATTCLVLALGSAVYSSGWSPLVPVILVAVLCGWWAGRSQLNGKQAAGWVVALGLSGVFVYSVGLLVPLWYLFLSICLIIFQAIYWLYNRSPVNPEILLAAWVDLSGRAVAALTRLWEWLFSLTSGQPAVDLAAAGLAWSLLLWLIGSWSGWQLRRKRLALQALAPGGVVLALVLEYNHESISFLVVYFACLLALTGITHYKENLNQWAQRGVDYAESIAPDSALVAVPVIMFLVGAAALTPSLSWQDWVNKIREANRRESGQVVEEPVFETRPNVANDAAYRSDGLPRLLLLNTPPELLEDLVMTVSVEDAPVDPETSPPRYYWRTVTYDLYTGGSWTSRPAQEVTLPADTTLLDPASGYQLVRQQIELEPNQSQRVYWTGSLAQADTDIKIAWRIMPPSNPDPIHNGDMLGALTSAGSYNILSFIPRVSQTQLQAAGRVYPPETVDRYLYLPDSIPGRVHLLARELTNTLANPYDQALAIESYLRAIPYTLEVPPPPYGRDTVDYFLFTLQKGYCDYYASSMVVMARAVGLPARIVVGYTSGDYDATNRQYLIRKKHAHTWVEIYFPEIGWVEFEPTGNQPPISKADDSSDSQLDVDQFPEDMSLPWLQIQLQSLISTLIGQTLLVLVGLIAFVVLWQTANGIYLQTLPPPIAINRIYKRLEKISIRLLPGISRGHTPSGIQTALSNKLMEVKSNTLTRFVLRKVPSDIENLTTFYISQTYTQHPPSKLQVRSGIKAWFRLRWKLQVVRLFKWIKTESNKS